MDKRIHSPFVSRGYLPVHVRQPCRAQSFYENNPKLSLQFPDSRRNQNYLFTTRLAESPSANAPDDAVYKRSSLSDQRTHGSKRRTNAAIMQHPYQPNGYAPPTNGVPSQARDVNDQNWLRTPTVGDALPFTPFSSIVPFNPGMKILSLSPAADQSHAGCSCSM